MKKNSQLFSSAILILYGVVLALLAWSHEPWRDEVRALSIVHESGSFIELLSNLKNEGHPALWYFALAIPSFLSENPVVLKLTAIFFAIGSAWLVIFRAPFSLPLKALFLLGLYPLYEYSVQCRNYGIGMFFLLLYLAVYDSRFKKPIQTGFILLLLANTSAYGLITAGALTFSLLVETFVSHREHLMAVIKSAGLAAIGAAFSAALIYPDSTTIVTDVRAIGAVDLLHAIVEGLVSHGSFAHNAFWIPFSWMIPLLMVFLYVLFFRKPPVVAFLFAMVLGVELIDKLIYSGGALRHQGFLYLAVFSCFWMDEKTPSERKRLPIVGWGAQAVLVGLLCLQVYSGTKAAYRDLMHPMSSAKAFGQLVSSHAELRDAVVMSEPYYMLETIAYYAPNPTYLHRQKRFGKTVTFTSRSIANVSLRDLLAQARLFNAQGKSVLLLLPNDLPGDGELKMMYGKKFVYTKESMSELQEAASRIVRFDAAVSDENYSVYFIAAQSPFLPL